ncbi:C2H2-type zinc finger protein Ecym_1383 [Eremothecium cymbalariae DBVPG|uniref:C2H2-type domain-containing protein n=1 Tax=Eremothecium cymbalariae (strain CBS 270.75 / DBVPG 7215 / KCTC 17166 / NRRL Y-17582) TaxID=931890 RepID=G8JNF0_ERECY|nr:hypothetical protein Ecym_1383 [Eremothecium cymbalariae DBVPG\
MNPISRYHSQPKVELSPKLQQRQEATAPQLYPAQSPNHSVTPILPPMFHGTISTRMPNYPGISNPIQLMPTLSALQTEPRQTTRSLQFSRSNSSFQRLRNHVADLKTMLADSMQRGMSVEEHFYIRNQLLQLIPMLPPVQLPTTQIQQTQTTLTVPLDTQGHQYQQQQQQQPVQPPPDAHIQLPSIHTLISSNDHSPTFRPHVVRSDDVTAVSAVSTLAGPEHHETTTLTNSRLSNEGLVSYSSHSAPPPPFSAALSATSSMDTDNTAVINTGTDAMKSGVDKLPTPNKRRKCVRNQCPVCAKVCHRPSSLRNHMYIHTGRRPFLCEWPGCEKRFNVKSNMVRHYRLHQVQENKEKSKREGEQSLIERNNRASRKGLPKDG